MKKIRCLCVILYCICTITLVYEIKTYTEQALPSEKALDQSNRMMELLNIYKNCFMRNQNRLVSTSMTSLLAQIKAASYPDEFWQFFDFVVNKNELIIMHACAREYIDRIGNPQTDSYFTENTVSKPIKEIIRKQYFLKTNDHNILKKTDGSTVTLSLFEVIISRPTTIMNSKLNLSNLHLASIDEIGMYKSIKLEEIDLSHNCLATIPPTVCTLTRLKYLDCSHNKIKQLPDNFNNLQHLIKLNLSNNKFELFPESVCQLYNLKRLDIDHNKIKQLPESIKNLENLYWLLINDNHVEKIPESLSLLTKLHKVDLSNNNLKELPTSFAKSKRMQHINLAGNPCLV